MSSTSTNSKAVYQPWPHYVAWALVATVFPLIWVGGLVTTHDAGLAVPDWPSTYGYNMFLYPWTTWLAGPWDLFIEHGHRLLGSLAGMMTIAFLVSVFRTDVPATVRWLAPSLLLLVVLQGVLGGLRVRMKSESLALIHGCVGPLFFACCCGAVVLTSRRWHEAKLLPNAESLSRTVLTGLMLAYGQLVFGAMLRHPADDGSPRWFQMILLFHIILGLALWGHIAAMLWKVSRVASAASILKIGVRAESVSDGNPASAGAYAFGSDELNPKLKCCHSTSNDTWLLRPAQALCALGFLQIALGFSTLIVKYGWPAWLGGHALPFAFTVQAKSFWSSIIVTGHVAVGSLILACMTTLWLRTSRLRGSGFLRQSHRSATALGVAL